MKRIIYLFFVFTLFHFSALSQKVNTKNALEQRLDLLLGNMSMQEKIEQLYYNTDGNPRFGIPQFKGSDGPHGIGNGAKGFSCFPVTIAMAATWDTKLIQRVGRAISLEQASRGRDRIAGPTLDLLIDPRIGRAPETIGEDPFLGGRISEAFVQGQNTTSVFGTIKHYNLNTYELNRRTNNYVSDNRSLVEFWGYHWKRTIQQGGAISVMCAYNWVNGDKCAENKYLIKDVLRDTWGYNFYTMCDWGGFSSTEKALKSELDFCEGNDLYIKELPAGVKNGEFDSTLVDRAARNVLRTKILSGMIDGVPQIPKSVVDSKEHRELVYESGLKSLVLLKNEANILPLIKEDVKSIALIGPNAGFLPLDGNSSSKVLPSYRISVEKGLKNIVGEERVKFVKGCNINDKDKSNFKTAIETAKNAEYVIFVAGLDSTVEGEGYFLDKENDEKGGGAVNRPDRASQTVLLPGVQNDLIKEIAKVNPNIILVVISGGICSVTPVVDDIKGLLYAFYPGQEGGRAIADVLMGNYNPSGKLPATMPQNDSQINPITTDFRNMVSKGVGYRWFDSQKLTPEFPFGFGLSYTTFTYSNIKINNPTPKAGDLVEISFDLKNTGKLAGEEVAQLYLSTGNIVPNVPMPVKQLRGFEKVFLNAGETKNITFTLTPEDFYMYNETTKAYQVPTGEFLVQVGGSSDNAAQKIAFKLLKSAPKSDLSVVNIRTMPTFPKEGEEVVFLASIINNGTAATKKGDAHSVRFYVDGKEVAHYYSKSTSIPIGGMELICAEGINGKNWKATNGTFQIVAKIETPENKDLHKQNNICEEELRIPNGKVVPKLPLQIYKDASAPIELRIKDLLSKMTLAEKCAQLDIWHPKMDVSKPDILQKTVDNLGDTVKNGIGFLQFKVEMNNADYRARFNAVQKYFVEKTRLGIPAISNGEGCHGFVGNENKSTVFPVSPSLGSTWNPELVESVYGAVAKEMRSYGITHAATPVIDLLRDPRFGRSEEFFGEDPYHVAQMGVAAIFGLQGRSPLIDENHLIACAKHFAGHGQPEGGTNLAPSNLSERILRENHFYPFEMAVKKANVRTVMASYNEIDGVPNHANKWLLTDVLRGEWGFTGYVISDYDAVNRMITRQHACATKAEAGKRAINAGMDFECPSSWKEYCFRSLPELIQAGEVKESILDSAVARVLRNKFIMGLFENPYIKTVSEKEQLEMQKAHHEIALKAAEQGIILLKNDQNTLPFNSNKIKRLAVIGPNADEVHYGNYSNDITPGISILEGLKNFGKGKFEVFYSEGFKIYENDTTIKAAEKTPEAENIRIRNAVELAKTCDAVLLVMGGNELTCREEWKNHTGDHYDLDLLGRQDDLAKAIFDLGKQTAVLLINGRPQSTNYLSEKAPAMLEGWYFGQEQGTAVANVIFGKVNPSGKLAVTIPRHVGQLPVYYNRKPYMHESPYINGEYSPLYPFGFGLSYTTFKYSNLRLSTKEIQLSELSQLHSPEEDGLGVRLKVSIDVTNSGELDGDEIVQLYIRDMVSSVTRPVQELKDFKRISLAKGETKTVEFIISPDKLQFFNIDMKRVIEPGEFEVQVGASSANYFKTTFNVN